MIGPLTLITTDPLLLLVLVTATLFGVILKGTVQARLAAALGDSSAVQSGSGLPEPAVHLSLWRLALYLLVGVALPRPVLLALRGQSAATVLLSGPPVLLACALVLLLLQRLQQQTLPTTADVIGLGLGRAALALTLHAAFNLLPLPQLDLGWTVGRVLPPSPQLPRPLRGTFLPALAWATLFLSGGLQWAAAPLWRGCRR
ncbi:hypothetical protein V3W47_12740 [Deinococcus sp. YIM 134068]|uniref:hypothetical protein n=1 Tax=Deinococcus lichenicola TaxID=3118910 RepID=UPI002F94B10E